MKKLVSVFVAISLLLSFAFASDVDRSPVGMWSVYWDARELNKILGESRMSFDIQAYTLFLMDDGSAFMQKATVKQGNPDFSPDLLPGKWTDFDGLIRIKLPNKTYNAWIDDSGRLFFQMTDSMAYIFNRVPLYNYEDGFLK